MWRGLFVGHTATQMVQYKCLDRVSSQVQTTHDGYRRDGVRPRSRALTSTMKILDGREKVSPSSSNISVLRTKTDGSHLTRSNWLVSYEKKSSELSSGEIEIRRTEKCKDCSQRFQVTFSGFYAILCWRKGYETDECTHQGRFCSLRCRVRSCLVKSLHVWMTSMTIEVIVEELQRQKALFSGCVHAMNV